MAELMSATREHFNLVPDERAEYSIEVDPREASADTIALLRALGFNRISLGVQDFDERVQRAVNRIQPREMTETVLDAARDNGFKSVSVDLIYGLPHQSVESFSRTLDAIVELKPDRVSVFGYAHMPSLFKMQRQIDDSALPSPAVRLAILERVISRMSEAGYVYIGMDHFALPGDELARAFEAGTLQRNFQGYSTHADCDLIGIGASSIGKIGDVYAQKRPRTRRLHRRDRRGQSRHRARRASVRRRHTPPGSHHAPHVRRRAAFRRHRERTRHRLPRRFRQRTRAPRADGRRRPHRTLARRDPRAAGGPHAGAQRCVGIRPLSGTVELAALFAHDLSDVRSASVA
jgi:coproporphyrinogen III oxidase-like Fe-S oxidoreductase